MNLKINFGSRNVFQRKPKLQALKKKMGKVFCQITKMSVQHKYRKLNARRKLEQIFKTHMTKTRLIILIYKKISYKLVGNKKTTQLQLGRAYD